MKKALPILFFSLPLAMHAQIQPGTKTMNKIGQPVADKVQVVNVTPQQLQQILANSASTTKRTMLATATPATLRTLPDGTKVRVTMKPVDGNTSSSFGGSISENSTSKPASQQNGFICKDVTKQLSANSTTYMNVNYDQSAAFIYPGAAYPLDKFMSGNFVPVNQGRYPMTIITDNYTNLTPANTSIAVAVPIPNDTALRQAVAVLSNRNGSTGGSANLQYRIFTGSNDAEMSLKLSAGGGYAGFKASAGYNASTNSHTKVITYDIIKPLFTLTAIQSDSGFYRDKSVTAANPNIVVMKSVTYGTRILVNVTCTFTSAQDEFDFKASFGSDSGNNVSANAQAAMNYLVKSKSDQTTANGYIIGGPVTTATFNTDNLQTEINNLLNQCNYSMAKPIAYSFMDLNGNSLGIYSATDQFTVQECTPASLVYHLSGASIDITTGTDNKDQNSKLNVYLSNGDNQVVFANRKPNLGEYPDVNHGATPKHLELDLEATDGAQLLKSLFDQKGGHLDMVLDPAQIFLGLDKWNINKVVLNLEFQDQNGHILTPSSGSLFQVTWDLNNISLGGVPPIDADGKKRLILYFNKALKDSGVDKQPN